MLTLIATVLVQELVQVAMRGVNNVILKGMMKVNLDSQDLARISKALKMHYMYLVSQRCCDAEIHDLVERFDHLRRVDASKN